MMRSSKYPLQISKSTARAPHLCLPFNKQTTSLPSPSLTILEPPINESLGEEPLKISEVEAVEHETPEAGGEAIIRMHEWEDEVVNRATVMISVEVGVGAGEGLVGRTTTSRNETAILR